MEFYVQYQRQEGRPHPHVLERPRLKPYARRVLEIFHEVDRYRIGSDGRRPLTPADIELYCRVHGTPGAWIEPLWWHFRRMDETWLELIAEKRQRDQEHEQFFAKHGARMH